MEGNYGWQPYIPGACSLPLRTCNLKNFILDSMKFLHGIFLQISLNISSISSNMEWIKLTRHASATGRQSLLRICEVSLMACLCITETQGDKVSTKISFFLEMFNENVVLFLIFLHVLAD